ncbi:MAG: UDP-N-acetylmuramoyl-L-alanyl-D-glutamate--2,6-diaminopimelate ligase [Proteobacteria bacterium]|nr:UDP-N-acetylmuramoyl-L-alanyl-D-glutamate--2,6-diaminopimelate ligase [Pseudomonadota bacterium]
MLSLSELIAAASDITPPANADAITITGITADSRQVKPGALFVALKGQKVDGAAYAAQAQQAGAAAVLCEAGVNPQALNIPVLRTGNVTLALARLAAKFYAPQPKHMVAVTGTDGKTSTADFCRQLWQGMGKPSASVGTLGILAGTGEVLMPGTHTTPQPVELHSELQKLSARGIEHVCMEASSHGLHQHRLDGVRLEAGAFTNFGRDHLDYHHTVEDYFQAKLRLFTALLPQGAAAVLNQDDARFEGMKAACEARGLRVLGFGKKGEQLRLKSLTPLPHGQRAEVTLLGKAHVLEIPVVGGFQAMNILAALGLVSASSNIEDALAVIARLRGVPGRLEQTVLLANGAAVFIDYAHTPLALANILNTLRPHTAGKLHVVFGCGGDRDAGKRPEMGRIASELADHIIVTDDNPRSEVPASIRAAILNASPRAKEVADRREAIYVALQALSPGDILVIAGKGHEKTQIVAGKTFPFDDAEVSREAARELKLAA